MSKKVHNFALKDRNLSYFYIKIHFHIYRSAPKKTKSVNQDNDIKKQPFLGCYVVLFLFHFNFFGIPDAKFFQ